MPGRRRTSTHGDRATPEGVWTSSSRKPPHRHEERQGLGTRRFASATGTRTGTRRAVLATVVAAIGLGGALVAGPAFAESPAAQRAHAEPLVEGTPCSVSAKACVDLESQRAWLIQDGKVTRGPVRISSGGNGQETPVGHSLRVYRKE